MKISGVMPLRNAVKLSYPFELAIRSLQRLCDETVILVDPTSEDDTMARVKALTPTKIVESVWDMNNHKGHTNCEISIQTQKACDAASGDWIFSLQADEAIHENAVDDIREAVESCELAGRSGIEMKRIYFYGSLEWFRYDWSLWLSRLFKRELWKPDVDGAMRFDPINTEQEWIQIPQRIYHYSRVGDPQVIAERVRNLDGFFHEPDRIKRGEITAYDFSKMHKLDTYVIDAQIEDDPNGMLVRFLDLNEHPAGVREFFQPKGA